jgi:hypothetical protein
MTGIAEEGSNTKTVMVLGIGLKNGIESKLQCTLGSRDPRALLADSRPLCFLLFLFVSSFLSLVFGS